MAVWLTGCAIRANPESVELAQPIPIERVPLKTALVVPPGLEEHRWSGGASSLWGSLMTLELPLGRPTVEALQTRLAAASEVAPRSEAELLVEPAIAGAEWRIDEDSQAIKGAAFGVAGTAASRPAAVVSVDLQLIARTKDGREVCRRTVTGRGMGWSGTALSFSTERAATTAASYACRRPLRKPSSNWWKTRRSERRPADRPFSAYA